MTLVAMAQADPPAGRRISAGSLFARYISAPSFSPCGRRWRVALDEGVQFVQFFCLARRIVFVTTR